MTNDINDRVVISIWLINDHPFSGSSVLQALHVVLHCQFTIHSMTPKIYGYNGKKPNAYFARMRSRFPSLQRTKGPYAQTELAHSKEIEHPLVEVVRAMKPLNNDHIGLSTQ